MKSLLLPQVWAFTLPFLYLPKAQRFIQNCFRASHLAAEEKKRGTDTCSDDSEQGTPPLAVQWLLLDSTEGVAPVHMD